MFCKNCGQPVPEWARFCENCGTPVNEAPAGSTPAGGAAGDIESGEDITGRKVTENIYLCPDGKYRWIYEYRMLRNPAVLITVMKVLLLSLGIVMGFSLIVSLVSGDFRYWTGSDFLSFLRMFLIILLGMLVLGVISYLILAAVYGWSYQVLFTMDEEGVEQKQMKKDFKKAQAVGWLSAAAGLAAGSAGGIGAGLLAASRDSSSSAFRQVRKVKVVRRRHVIYLNQMLEHNQVYAEEADFDFVEGFIKERCVNAKIS